MVRHLQTANQSRASLLLPAWGKRLTFFTSHVGRWDTVILFELKELLLFSFYICIITINGIPLFLSLSILWLNHPYSVVQWFCGEDRLVLGRFYFRTPSPAEVSPNKIKLSAEMFYIFVNLRGSHVLQTCKIAVVPQHLPGGGTICKYMSRISLICSFLYLKYRIYSVKVFTR